MEICVCNIKSGLLGEDRSLLIFEGMLWKSPLLGTAIALQNEAQGTVFLHGVREGLYD